MQYCNTDKEFYSWWQHGLWIYRWYLWSLFSLVYSSEISHLVLMHLKFNLQMVLSHFQIGTVPELHYLKSGKFCTWPSLPNFSGSPRSCSPILTCQVIALPIVIPLSHMFYLAFTIVIRNGKTMSMLLPCQIIFL